MKKSLILLAFVYYASLTFATVVDQNNLTITNIEQEFIVPFGEQCNQGIWNGRAVIKINSIKEAFDGLQYIQQEYKLDTDIFMLDGIYYNVEALKRGNLKISKDYDGLIMMKEMLNRYTSLKISGKVFQKAGGYTLLIETGLCNGKIISLSSAERMIGRHKEFDTVIIALELFKGHPFLELADGEEISIQAIKNGIYEYTTALGASKSVQKYSLKVEEKETLEREISQLRSSLPIINYKNYLWYVYCQGIRRDFEKGLIKQDPNCSYCKGKGKILCNICQGKGKTGFEAESLEVVDIGSSTRLKYERKIRTVENGHLPSKTSSEGKRQEYERNQRELESQRQLAKDKQIRDNNYPCCICKASAYLACPKCILVEKPNYSADAKNEYIKRWAK